MPKMNYKQAIKRLQEIQQELENNPPDIDELSALVHEAKDLLNMCRKKLRDTETEINNTLDSLSEPLE